MPGYAAQPYQAQPKKKKGLAVVSLVLGIIGFIPGLFGIPVVSAFLSMLFFGLSRSLDNDIMSNLTSGAFTAAGFLTLSFLAVLFSMIALIAKNKKGLSITGLILGLIPIILTLVVAFSLFCKMR